MRWLEDMQDRPAALLSWLIGVLVTVAAIVVVAVVVLPVISLLVGIGVVTLALIALVAGWYYLRWRVRRWLARRRGGDLDRDERLQPDEDDEGPGERPRKRLNVRVIRSERRH